MTFVTQEQLAWTLGGEWLNDPDPVAQMLITQAQSLAEQFLETRIEEHTVEGEELWPVSGVALLASYPAADLVVDDGEGNTIDSGFRTYARDGVLVEKERDILCGATADYAAGWASDHPGYPGLQAAVLGIAARMFTMQENQGSFVKKRKTLTVEIEMHAPSSIPTGTGGLTLDEQTALGMYKRRVPR